MKIGELARKSGFPEKTLRFYEEERVLLPSARTPSGYRLYDEGAVRTLDFVGRAKRFGFTLAEIREVLEAYREGRGACKTVQRLIGAKQADLIRRIAELRRLQEDLAELKRLSRSPSKVKGTWVCPILGRAPTRRMKRQIPAFRRR